MNSCKKCFKNVWKFFKKKGDMVTMKCRICGAKVTFNSKTSEARKVSSKNAQQLEDKRAEMLAEWKKSKRLSTGVA